MIENERIEEMMMDTGFMTKDLGTILVGEEAVKAGIIDEVGGVKDAFRRLNRLIRKTNKDSGKN